MERNGFKSWPVMSEITNFPEYRSWENEVSYSCGQVLWSGNFIFFFTILPSVNEPTDSFRLNSPWVKAYHRRAASAKRPPVEMTSVLGFFPARAACACRPVCAMRGRRGGISPTGRCPARTAPWGSGWAFLLLSGQFRPLDPVLRQPTFSATPRLGASGPAATQAMNRSNAS